MLGDCATLLMFGYACIFLTTPSSEKGSDLKTRQITVGFDVEVSPQAIAVLLASVYGDVTVGEGISENGLPLGSIYVANKKRKRKNV
jgi:hypothetical protein